MSRVISTTRIRRPLTFVAWLSAVVAIALAAGGCSSSSKPSSSPTSVGPDVVVKVGYQPDLHGAGLLDIGIAHRFWERFGINLQAVQFSNGPTEMQAMAGGDIQFGYLGPGALWIPAEGRAKIITLDSLESGDWVVGRPGITTIADLKGRTVGYAQGTSGEMILRLALQRAGLTLSDIHAVNLDATAVVPAFLSHHIDAAASWVPLVQAIRTTEPKANFLVNDSAFSSQHEFPDVWVASPSEVADHPDVVVRFLEGFILANDYRMSHTAETVALVAGQTGAPSAGLTAQNAATSWIDSKTLAKEYVDGTAARWISSLEQLLSSMGKLNGPVPASEFTAFDLFRQAEAKATS